MNNRLISVKTLIIFMIFCFFSQVGFFYSPGLQGGIQISPLQPILTVFAQESPSPSAAPEASISPQIPEVSPTPVPAVPSTSTPSPSLESDDEPENSPSGNSPVPSPKPVNNPDLLNTTSPMPASSPVLPIPAASPEAAGEVVQSPSPSPSPSPIDVEAFIKKSENTRLSDDGAPVIVDNLTLFYMYSTVGPYTPLKRAAIVTGRIKSILDRSNVNPDAFKYEVSKSGKSCGIYYGEERILSIREKEATSYNSTVEELGDRWTTIIKLTAEDYVRKREQKLAHKGLFVGIAGLILLLLVIYLAVLLSKRVSDKIESLKGTKIKAFTFQSVVLLTEDNMASIFFTIFRFGILFAILALFYFYFNYFLTYYPGTQVIRTTLYDLPLQNFKRLMESIIAYLPKLIFIIIAIMITRYILKFNDIIFDAIKRGAITVPGFHPEFRRVMQKIMKFLIYFFALSLIAPNLPGYASPAFKGLSIFTGVIVSLGSSSFVSNIIAGIMIAYSRPFARGDRVKIGDQVGDIIGMSLLIIRMRTYEDIDVTIPNAVVLQSQVINYSSSIEETGAIKLCTTITIGYDVPGEKVRDLCLMAVDNTENFLKTPPPYTLQKSLDDFYVSYEIYGYTDQPKKMKQTYSDLHSNIRKFFDENGVEIMSPHYSSLRDGNAVTIPEKYLPKEYKAPPFNIFTK